MNRILEVKSILRDGIEIKKLKCPACGQWADIDDDQYYGRISILHEECGFHATINLAKKI